MTLPSFICIGAQKSGTSWLHSNLRRHPQVWMPEIKELHYFDHIYSSQVREWSDWHIKSAVGNLFKKYLSSKYFNVTQAHYLVDILSEPRFTEDWYRRCFANDLAEGKVCGEISPEYSCIPDDGILYLKNFLPNVKIIYLIRDPFERALSQIRMYYNRKNIAYDGSDLISVYESLCKPDRADYINYIPRWKNFFSDDNLLILPFGMIKNDPKKLMSNINNFLGLSPFDYGDSVEKIIHSTPPIEFPLIYLDELEQKLLSQRTFLHNEFGDDFFSQIYPE